MNCSECGIYIEHHPGTGGVWELPKSHLPPCATCEKRGLDAINTLNRNVAQAVQSNLFDSILYGASCTNTVDYGPSPIASALPSAKSLSETLKELDAKFASVPSRTAYLVMPPDMYAQIPITPIEWPADGPDRSMMGFRILQDYDFRLSVPRPILYGDICGSDPYVPPFVWKDAKLSAKPSAVIWCVVVAFLCWLMCAADGLL
jgi:hypothetical protein